jgi:N-acetylmuramate 1-kinase
MSDQRQTLAMQWLSSLPETFKLRPQTLRIASADASFRRYFRVDCQVQTNDAAVKTASTAIVMDAPPAHEDVKPFVHVAQKLLAAGVRAPKILAANTEEGFLLLDDLGDATYLGLLDEHSAKPLYNDAINALIQMQCKADSSNLPFYNRELLLREMRLYSEWYVPRHKNITLTDKQNARLEISFEKIIANNLAQQTGFVHRDYHSRNLMLVSENNPGIIDFQDAVVGPLTYDLVSLLKDAYIRWEEDQVMDWCIRYWETARKAGLNLPSQFGDFYRDFEWMGLQRHLKILGIFARLNYRDGKSRYLNDIPLVLEHTIKVCQRYSELFELRNLLLEVEGNTPSSGYTF